MMRNKRVFIIGCCATSNNHKMVLCQYNKIICKEYMLNTVAQTHLRASLGFFSLSPRLGRIQYLALSALWAGVFLIIFFLPLVISFNYILILLIVGLTLFVACINLILIMIRRLHDFEYSGWWIILNLIPFVGLLFTIFIGNFNRVSRIYQNRGPFITSKVKVLYFLRLKADGNIYVKYNNSW